jgi:DNA-binding transcriptional regulator YiaG
MVIDPVKLARVRHLVESGEAKTLRTDLNLSLGDIAIAIKVDQSTVYRWEHNKRKPRGAAAIRYGRLLEALARERSEPARTPRAEAL